MLLPPAAMRSRSFARRHRHLDLEVADVRNFPRHAGQQVDRKRCPGHRRILDHDGDVDGIRHGAIELDDSLLGYAESGAVIGRHDHDHRSARVLGLAAALGADARTEMRRRHDHGHPAGDVLQHRVHHRFALGIGQDELLGEIGQNAEAVGAGFDHEIDTAALTREIKLPAIVKNGRSDRENTAIRPFCSRGHSGCSVRTGSVIVWSSDLLST